jgi:hypothetical protein
MSGWRALPVVLLLAAGFTYGLMRLFGVQFASGSVYPEYSSLRSDPTGSKLLFESLARMPGIAAVRSFGPLEFTEETNATIVLLGLGTQIPNLETMERAAGRGNRIVVAFNAESVSRAPRAGALEKLWHVRLGVDLDKKHVHHLYFAEAKEWRVLDRVGEKLLAIERGFGKGTVVLLAESDSFSNESAAAADQLELVSAALGDHSRMVFDEQHFGISESGSIVGMARRFRLGGLGFGLALCAALFIWRNASQFPPPASTPPVEAFAGRTSLSGLLTLLRRHIPPSELPAVCWREWQAGNRHAPPERLKRADASAREIQAALHSKGEL